MYNLKVINNFIYDLNVNDGQFVPSGESETFNKNGNLTIGIPGIGSCLFADLGDNKLEGYPSVKETWGVLMRFHSSEAYYRYEGQGELIATFDNHGTCTLSTTNGTLIPIRLDELTVETSGL